MHPFDAELFVFKVNEVLGDLLDNTCRKGIIQTVHSGKVDGCAPVALGVGSIGVFCQGRHLLAAIAGRQCLGTPLLAAVGDAEDHAVVERVRIVVALVEDTRELAPAAATAAHVICKEDGGVLKTARVDSHTRVVVSSWRRFAADKLAKVPTAKGSTLAASLGVVQEIIGTGCHSLQKGSSVEGKSKLHFESLMLARQETRYGTLRSNFVSGLLLTSQFRAVPPSIYAEQRMPNNCTAVAVAGNANRCWDHVSLEALHTYSFMLEALHWSSRCKNSTAGALQPEALQPEALQLEALQDSCRTMSSCRNMQSLPQYWAGNWRPCSWWHYR